MMEETSSVSREPAVPLTLNGWVCNGDKIISGVLFGCEVVLSQCCLGGLDLELC